MAHAWWRDSDYELFCRLERERNEARAEVERLREACASMVEDADDGVPLQCLADAIRTIPLVTEEKP